MTPRFKKTGATRKQLSRIIVSMANTKFSFIYVVKNFSQIAYCSELFQYLAHEEQNWPVVMRPAESKIVCPNRAVIKFICQERSAYEFKGSHCQVSIDHACDASPKLKEWCKLRKHNAEKWWPSRPHTLEETFN